MKKALLSCTILFSLILTGCYAFRTPPPGWRDPVYQLLLQEDSFPDGWDAGYEVPAHIKDPTTNHVTMEWLHDNGGLVYQSIWRAYTIEDAKSKFNELKHPPYGSEALTSGTKNVAFTPPSEIKFKSAKADEFYIVCGRLDYAYCIIASRYRNYVVSLHVDLSGTIGDYTQDEGLTYSEIETLLRDMDKIFHTIQK